MMHRSVPIVLSLLVLLTFAQASASDIRLGGRVLAPGDMPYEARDIDPGRAGASAGDELLPALLTNCPLLVGEGTCGAYLDARAAKTAVALSQRRFFSRTHHRSPIFQNKRERAHIHCRADSRFRRRSA